jgi:TRAP-type mannitol/chloroaromatic compound transport system permease large subunit
VDVYYVIGSVLAACALLVSLLGVVRKDFPGSRGGELAVGAVFVALVLATISAAVVGALTNEEEGEEQDHGAVPALVA